MRFAERLTICCGWGCCLLMLMALGCKPAPPTAKSDTGSGTSSNVARPAVPLRVWFVSDDAAGPVIQRQWQANYDRELELNMLTTAELLDQKKCMADVLIVPAMTLGELVARDWLAELPARLQPVVAGSEPTRQTSGNRDGQSAASEEAALEAQPAGWQEQARFGKRTWGLSLSVTMPLVMTNFACDQPPVPAEGEAVTAEDSQAYWQAIIDALSKAQAANAANNGVDAAATPELDPLATCERFLLIATSLTDSDSRVGLLFDPQTMASRLENKHFVTAATLMQAMHRAGAPLSALAGSHSAAWQALCSPTPCISLTLPPAADEEVDKVNTIRTLQPPINPARAGARTTSGWNNGQGLVVCVARDCRQSAASIEFVRWLYQDTTRTAFAKRVPGFSSESAYAPSSSAWQAQRIVQRLAQQSRICLEPRLPEASRFRQTLGQELIAMLRGEKEPVAALEAATTQWQKIIEQRGKKVVQTGYEQSLGLAP